MKSNSGQSLVEFAITLVFILFLLVGAFEFGTVLFQYVQLRDAAQDGAVYGSMFPDDTVSIEKRVRYASNTPINLTSPEVQVDISFKLGKQCEGDALKVSVQYPHRIVMPFLSNILSSDVIMLNAEVVDTVLSPVCK